MTAVKETPAIEVEVLEIDGVVPVAKLDAPENRARPKWEKWLVLARKLDRRWWPLWVVLGSIFLILALTVGVVLGLVMVMVGLVRGFFRMLFR